MSWQVHRLDGCTANPLARYLKALGVLRLVAEQADKGARGFWKDGTFHLATTLSLDDLVTFFVEKWSPTPIVTPWNQDGGFIGEVQEKTDAMVVARMLEARGERFEDYVKGAYAASQAVAGFKKSPKDEEKFAFFGKARAEWGEAALAWLDAVVVLLPDAEKPSFPALLASGGCDGRFDFAASFRKRLAQLFGTDKKAVKPEAAKAWCRGALVSGPLAKLPDDSGGQMDPGSTSPVNGGSGFRGDSAVNPWDYLLAFEGIPVMRVAAGRRLRTNAVLASAPFQVRGISAGYGSSSGADEAGRGEQWVPLWRQPATYDEVRKLFAEGRMLTGAKAAASALDAAKAIARLGIARGIEAFERYGFVPRNGQSSLAVSLGRWPVTSNPEVRLLDDIERWVDQLRRASGAKGAPASMARDVRLIESAMFEICRNGKISARWQDLICLLGQAETNLAARGKFTKEHWLKPLPQLHSDWLLAAADGSAEVRIAAAIALEDLPEDLNSGKICEALGPMRMHALPLSADARWTAFATAEAGLAKDPRVVWQGTALVADLAALVARRILESNRAGTRVFALTGPLTVGLGDVEAFLGGRTNDLRIAALARGFMALAKPKLSALPALRERLGVAKGLPLALHALVRLTNLPKDVGKFRANSDGKIIRLLIAGRLDEAIGHAVRRLRAGGLATRLRLGVGSPSLAMRLAASLALPIATADIERLLHCITKPASVAQILDRD